MLIATNGRKFSFGGDDFDSTATADQGGQTNSTAGAVVAAVQSAPSLTSVSPTSFPADANNHTMRLLGSNFVSGDTLTFTDPQGNVIASTASKLTFVSSGEIDYQFNDGSDPGNWSVKVNTADGTLHSSADTFSVAAAQSTPSLSSVSPTSFPADASNHTMRLLGSNFVSGDTLTFTDPQGNVIASTASKLTFVSSGEIDYQFNDGSDPGNWSVKVNTADGTLHSSADTFSVAAAQSTPSLSSVSPISFPADANNHTMQLLGSNFVSGDTLTFTDPQGNVIASTASKLTFVSSGEIDYQFNDGSDPGNWSVKVNTADGTLHSSADTFSVAAAQSTPSLSSVSPISFPADANNHTMQLLGSNFVSGDTLTFTDPQGNVIASTASKLTFVSSGEIDYQFNDGSDPGNWSVKVNTADGTLHSSADTFSVAAAQSTPSLSSVSPSSFPADASNHTMQLLGSNFVGGDTLTFTDPQGNVIASTASKLTVVSSGEIDYQFNDGSDPGNWSVKVNTADGTLHSSADSFSVAAQPNHLIITLTPDQTVIDKFTANYQTSSFWTNVTQAAQFFENTFDDPITININVGWGEADNVTLKPGFAGSNRTYEPYSFAQIVASLKSNSKSASDATAVAHLPTQDPGAGGTDFEIAEAEAKALGLQLPASVSPDGWIGFASNLSPTDTNFVGLAEHEISEVMGRVGITDAPIGYSVLDLFRYFGGPPILAEPGSSTGPNGIGTTYFSIDGGNTPINSFDGLNTPNHDDLGVDWAGATPDAFNGASNGPVSPGDITEMDVLGYDLVELTPSLSSVSPTSFPADASNHTMQLFGSSFQSGDTLTFTDPQGNIIASTAAKLTFVSSTEIDYQFNDGSDPGNWKVQVNSPDGTLHSSANSFSVAASGGDAGPYDFNGDGYGDILLQSASGQIEYANMAGGSYQGMVQVANTPGWSIVGAGRVAGNADSDIVILNNASSEIFYRDMLSGGASHWVDVTGAPGYAVFGVGDINHDGFADIVIQNHSDGTILWANMANGVFNGWKALTSTPGWNVVGVADVNDDGFADVLIQNQSDGTIFYGNMAGGAFNHWVPMTGSTLPGWKAVGAGDIMGNGYASEVIQETDGSIVYANMTGGVFHNWLNVGATPGWNVVAVEDVLGNGYDDIVIENATTGDVYYANMTGGTFQHWVAVTATPGFTGHTGPGNGELGHRVRCGAGHGTVGCRHGE